MANPQLEWLKDRFRSDVDDADLDPTDQSGLLWSDDDVLEYIDWAHSTFIARTLYLRGRERMTVIANDPIVIFPDKVLEPRGTKAHLVTQGVIINEVNAGDLVRHTDDYGSTLEMDPYREQAPGRPIAYSLDIEDRRLRLFPPSATGDELDLDVYYEADEIDSWHCSPQIKNRRHLRMLLGGMKHRAYMKSDADTYNGEEAARWLAIFERDMAEVTSERKRRQRRPGTIRYGGL